MGGGVPGDAADPGKTDESAVVAVHAQGAGGQGADDTDTIATELFKEDIVGVAELACLFQCDNLGLGSLSKMDQFRVTFVHGDNTLMTEFRLKAGSVLPRHEHPHEQTGYLVQGSLRLTLGEEEHLAEPGDSWCIPGGVVHGAVAIEDSIAVEVFSPVREDYLPEEEDQTID